MNVTTVMARLVTSRTGSHALRDLDAEWVEGSANENRGREAGMSHVKQRMKQDFAGTALCVVL